MQKLSKASAAIAEDANLAPFTSFVIPYILFQLEKKTFLELNIREQGWAPREQLPLLLNEKDDVNDEAEVKNVIWNMPSLFDAALQFVTYL